MKRKAQEHSQTDGLDETGRSEALRSARSRGWIELLEREAEVAAIRRALESAQRGTGGAIVVEGPPGMGKSAVMEAGLQLAQAAHAAVIRARCAEVEADFEFGVARQLLESSVSDRGARRKLLAGAAALARPVFEPSVESRMDDGAQSVIHGLFWLASNLANAQAAGRAGGTLVVGVDDLQWCDEASLRFLLYALQRVDELPLLLVLAARPAVESDSPLLTRIRNHPLTDRHALRPLSLAAVSQLARTGYFPRADDRFCAACADVSGGNPFVLRALLEELDTATGDGGDAAERVSRLMPASVLRSVVARIARLPASAATVATAVAVLEEHATLHRVAVIAQLSLEEATAAVNSLVEEGILADGRRIEFRHSLVRSALVDEIESNRAQRMRIDAARILWEEGEAAEVVAAHLLHARPSGKEWVVQVLRESARTALGFGAADVAARHLRRALEEPLPAEARGEILLDLGLAQARAGDTGALTTLEQARRVVTSRPTQVEVLRQIGRMLHVQGRHSDAVKVFETALTMLDDPDGALGRELKVASFASGSMAALGSGRPPDIPPDMPETVTEEPASLAERNLLAQLAVHTAFMAGPAERTMRLATAAWGHGRLLEEETSDGMMWSLVTAAYAMAGEYTAMLQAAESAVQDARRRGSVLAFATASYVRGAANFFLGRLNDAIADEQQALDMRRYEWHMYELAATSFLARALIEQGRLDAASCALHEVDAGFSKATAERGMLFMARGELLRARGRNAEALEDFLRARDDSAGIAAPNWIPWRSGAVPALIALGRVGEAAALAHDLLEVAQRTGAHGAIGRGLRLLAMTQESAQEAEATYRRAVEVLQQSQDGLALLHAQMELGALLRRSGRTKEAREHLTQAVRLGTDLGAYAAAARAREELQAAGGRSRRAAVSGWESLTPQEQRVAQMAAGGMANRDIAQALFVTVKAVEWHLGNVYQKLRVRSRRELPEALRVRSGNG